MDQKVGKMLSFYKENKVAPVSQNISDLEQHFHRRSTMYRQLGIQPFDFHSKRVVEIGPGTGQNSLHIASLRPESLTLVEPNPTGVEKITELFATYPAEGRVVSVEHTSIEEFKGSSGYDYVICEGLIGASGHPDPRKLIASVARFVNREGIIVLTSIDYPAYLSEMLRRLIGHELIKDTADFEKKVDILCEVYEPHLAFLPGMTRNSRDWAIDNLINPASVHTLVTFPDLVDTLANLGFSVSGTSPRFIADWAWYKDAALVPDFFNKSALDSYWKNAHGFLDYKNTYLPRTEESNRKLEGMCKNIHNAVREYEESNDPSLRKKIIDNINGLEISLREDMPSVSAALREVHGWLSEEKLDINKIKTSTDFGSWFGRSQTYVAFMLTNN